MELGGPFGEEHGCRVVIEEKLFDQIRQKRTSK
jgi:hypothetical protein